MKTQLKSKDSIEKFQSDPLMRLTISRIINKLESDGTVQNVHKNPGASFQIFLGGVAETAW